MSMRDALLRLVSAERKASAISKAIRNAGYSESVYDEIAGEISDAIYCMIGENTETYADSVTCLVLHTDILTDERRVAILLSEYVKNVGPIETAKQPKPQTLPAEEIRRMMNNSEGYRRAGMGI